SLVIATTAAPCFATSGRTASIDASSPVTELTSAFPRYASSPARRAGTTDESMERGTSTSVWTSSTVAASSAASSASGIPALTSSMSAPASTCATASASTREKSPRVISSARRFRPVGLMRSPITTKGRSKPITTSRVREASTVSVIVRSTGREPAAVADELFQYDVGEVGVELVGDHLRVGAGDRDLAVLGGVVVGADHPHPGGGAVDGFLEAIGQRDAPGPAALARHHLGGDVPPVDHRHLRLAHRAAS